MSNLEEMARLSRMIDSLLFLAHASRGSARVETEKVDLAAEADSVIEYHRAPADELGGTLLRTGSATLSADRTLLRRALSNLLSNAIRFSPPGSSIRVAIRPLAPGASPLEQDSFVIEVEDCVIAIPQDEIQSIFEEYHQSSTVSSLGLGRGLGLAIVRKFAELQGGMAQVEPNDRGGSTFRVWLPQNALEYETDSGPRRAL